MWIQGSQGVNEKWMPPQGLITMKRRKSGIQMKDNLHMRNTSKVFKEVGGQG